MNFKGMVFQPQYGAKIGPVNEGALKPMSAYLQYTDSLKPLSAQPIHLTENPPKLFKANPQGITRDEPHLACYKDVKLTKKEAPSWNVFSWLDKSQYEKGFEVAPRIIREHQP